MTGAMGSKLATVEEPPPAAPAATMVDQVVADLAMNALRVMLWLGLAFTTSFTLGAAIAGASTGRVILGVAMTLVWLAATRRPLVTAKLLSPAGSTLVLALSVSVVLAIDDPATSPYLSVASAVVALAAVTERPAWVAACVAVMSGGYLLALIISGHSVDWMTGRAHLYAEANTIMNLVLVSGTMLLGIRALNETLKRAPVTLADARQTGQAITPELGRAVAANAPVALLQAADPRDLLSKLTPSEGRVVAELTAGRIAKQIAADWQLDISTIRTHIANAKAKTGARTLEHLVALAVSAELRNGEPGAS